MGGKDDREHWAPVPGLPGLWASTAGRIATLKDGGGFAHVAQRRNLYGEVVVTLKAGGRRHIRLVAALVLEGHGRARDSGCRIGYRDGDPSNVKLDNLLWERKGRPRVVDLKKRKCLGNNCGVDFVSQGWGNRLCPNCLTRMDREGDGGLDSSGLGELPDEPLCGAGGNPHK